MRRELSYTRVWGRPMKGREVQKAGKKKKENDEALVPSSMKNCCSAQCCSSITLLKSTLLLSLLTPALDGLLSTPLLPSRLLGTEFGDASEPGGMKVWGRQEETNRLETLCPHVRRFHSFWLVCFVIHWVTRTSRFFFFKKNEEVNNSTAVYNGVGLAQEKWPPPHFLHCFYPTCHFDPLYDFMFPDIISENVVSLTNTDSKLQILICHSA